MEKHKAGFVSIIGKPNVGKSTLMNNLLGEHLSIVTHKAQTTRHRIKGILSTDDYQIVFSDTPGILEPHYLLQEKMMNAVQSSLEDADVILLITDLTETYLEEEFISVFGKIKVPVVILINKVDLSSTDEINKLTHGWKKKINPKAIIPISALKNFNLPEIIKTLVELIPESPEYYGKDQVSDANERFFASEIIREKIFLHYQKEIPYSAEVSIDEFKDERPLLRIRANIIVERNSQKGIIIGHKGEGLKRIGTEARKDMEKFFNKKIFLHLNVKVEEDWRKKENSLRRFGYST
jgi:GTP-binding protein Era